MKYRLLGTGLLALVVVDALFILRHVAGLQVNLPPGCPLIGSPYPAPSIYYPMDNTHVVTVRPDGKELYVYSYDPSNLILVVDIDSPGYPVIGEIRLPGRRALHTYISFSQDSRRAYMSRAIDCQYEGNCAVDFGELNKILVANTANREIEAAIPMPWPLTPLESVVPSPDGRWLYVTAGDFPSNRLGIGKLDMESQKVVGFLPLDGVNFITISGDGKRIYATQGCNLFGAPAPAWCHPPNLFSIVDAESSQVVSSVPVGDGPRYVAVTPDGRKAYVSNQWSNDISIVLNGAEDTAYLLGRSAEVIVVDMTRGEVVARIPFAGGPIHVSRGLALTPDESKLFVSDYYSQTVAVIDTFTKGLAARVPVANLPSEIRISQDGKRAYVLQQQGTTMMTVIDVDTYDILRRIDFPISGSLDFELSADERYAYIADFDLNFVMVYDLQEGKVAKVIGVGLDPFNMVDTPDGRLIYVTNFTTDDISVVDTTINTASKTIKLDGGSRQALGRL